MTTVTPLIDSSVTFVETIGNNDSMLSVVTSMGQLDDSGRAGHHHYNVIQDIMYMVLTPFFCMLGIIGNTTNIAVLSKSRKRMHRTSGEINTGTHLGLIILSISDLAFCIVLLPRAFFNLNGAMALFPQPGFRLYYQVYGTGLVTTLILTSTYITVCMTVLRYLGICHLFFARKMKMNICAVVLYILAIFISVLVNLPSFWQYQISHLSISNRTVYLIDIGPYTKNSIYTFLWCKTIYGIVFPFCILCYCNISLIRTLQESRRMRVQCRVQRSALHYSRRTTRMLISIVLLFILLVLPAEVLDFFHDIIKMNPDKTEVFLVVRSIVNLLQVINFSCNFLLYFSVNSHFRHLVRSVCSCNTQTDQIDDLNRYRESVDYKSNSMRRMSNYSNTTSGSNILVRLRDLRQKRQSMESHATCALSVSDIKA